MGLAILPFSAKPFQFNIRLIMIRLIAIVTASVIAASLSSCICCTSDPKTPKLRPLPKFREIEAAPTTAPGDSPVAIEPTK